MMTAAVATCAADVVGTHHHLMHQSFSQPARFLGSAVADSGPAATHFSPGTSHLSNAPTLQPQPQPRWQQQQALQNQQQSQQEQQQQHQGPPMGAIATLQQPRQAFLPVHVPQPASVAAPAPCEQPQQGTMPAHVPQPPTF